LYYRRQCVLNTVTDLQAYFLRAYGALEELEEDMKPTSTSACDAFHLGQMTRFFALRTKTIFLGSTLIDPDFSPDLEDDEYTPANTNNNSSNTPPIPSTDITALLASLKQCPDYQIDSNHTGCGIRRRFLPALDCIERFVGDGRGLLGISLRLWDRDIDKSTSSSAKPSLPSRSSWANRALRRAQTVDIRSAKITAVHYNNNKKKNNNANNPPGPAPTPLRSGSGSGSASQEEDARLLFTARRRNWEA
jgi:hypothetical protein